MHASHYKEYTKMENPIAKQEREREREREFIKNVLNIQDIK